ncbi:MAG: GGDEF domain-containing protein, partial [Hyphomicrobiales bacterium]|nr:GGDEF domain-containing protein [Hyphomicrobiales bacterium]
MANGWNENARSRDERPAILDAALAALPTAVEIFASDGTCVFANPAARALGGLGPDGGDREAIVRAERALLIERRTFDAEGAQYRIGAAIDISDERRLQDDLFQRAYFDDLTRLPNRGFFEEAVGRSIRADEATDFAIAIVGFDQFGAVNEFYGRAVGDALLIEAAKRIGGELGEADLAARSSGDEFSLMIVSQEAGNVEGKIDRILARIKDPFFVNGAEILISASAGLSLFPQHDATLDGLIAKAGAALAQAKRRYKGEARLYDPALAVRAQERARMEQDLRLAVRDRRFVCALQPKINFRTG